MLIVILFADSPAKVSFALFPFVESGSNSLWLPLDAADRQFYTVAAHIVRGRLCLICKKKFVSIL